MSSLMVEADRLMQERNLRAFPKERAWGLPPYATYVAVGRDTSAETE